MNPWRTNYNSNQGNVGLGRAIAYYTSQCFTVSLPLNDTQPYDLVVDKETGLYKISVKTTKLRRRNGDIYSVGLCTKSINSKGNNTTLFNNKSCDYVFVLTESGDMYEIPSKLIEVKYELKLTDKWDQYKILICN